MLQVITDLTKKGEKSPLAAINIITEEWLEALAKRAIGKEEMTKYSSQSSNRECNILEVIPQMIPQEIYSQTPQRARNFRFLSAIGYFINQYNSCLIPIHVLFIDLSLFPTS